jgi:hypothetical protein
MSIEKSRLICIVLVPVLFIGVVFIPPSVYLVGAIIAFAIGWISSGTGSTVVEEAVNKPMDQPSEQRPITTRVELPERKMPDNIPANLKCPSCGGSIKPTDKKCAFCGSILQPMLDLPEPSKLSGLEIGKSVRVVHPRKGPKDYHVRGRLLFSELWQASRGPQVPWTPTGNHFAGFPLEPAAYLLSWQDRFYLLEERRALTDMDINRDFAQYAQKFAQSNQTARVEFSYDGERWKMVDIGRFAIEFEDGEGSHLHKGAVGRFIHAASGSQALVIDDFQSGGSGGQDTLWRGFLINESDITF